jgi:energy-coupling factor transport system ATP-binding protein
MVIEIADLSVSFGQTTVLDGVNLVVQDGDMLLLAGASGSGKSTLLRAITGIIPHVVPARTQGYVRVGRHLTTSVPLSTLAQTAGLVFQNPSTQLFNLTVREEVGFGPHNLGMSNVEIQRRTAWALGVTGLECKAERDVRALSGGERQRVAIAAVLAMLPAVLALDEPMANLDVDGTRRVVEVLRDLNATRGTTVLIAEHRLREAQLVAHRAVLMDEGHVTADGPTATVLSERSLLRRLGLRRPALAPQVDWEALIVSGHPSAGASIVALQGAAASYGADTVLSGVDLDLREGECVALVGDNGSGKTTVARLLTGMAKPTRGSVRWARGTPEPGVDVGILLQEPREQVFCESVEAEVAFGPTNFGRADGVLLDRLLAAADLDALRHRPLHTLSSGQLHRTTLAAVLALQPRLLILDEPTVGQDWRHLEQLMMVVESLRAGGSAVLLISHDFKLIHRYATRVVLLRHGRITAQGVPLDAHADGE